MQEIKVEVTAFCPILFRDDKDPDIKHPLTQTVHVFSKLTLNLRIR